MPQQLSGNLSLVFVLISLAVLLANRLKFSSIPLLILLGILCGPNAPHFTALDLRLVTSSESVELLSRLGVLFLLFYLGLEFSAGRVVQNGAVILKGGSIYVGLNFLRGLALGWLFFYSWPETLIMAGITTVSSSAIVTKLLVELKRTANPETELILGIIVFEDVFMAVFLSLLSGCIFAQKVSLLAGLLGGLTTLVFILVLLFLGRRFSTHLDRWLGFHSSEAFIVLVFTLLILTALLAETLHVAEAVSALLLGLILAETSHAKRLVHMIIPMRDLFGAVFFFAFGMGIDYREFRPAIGVTVTAVTATIIGNLLAGWLSAWACGYRGPAAANVACTIIARGEFAIIIAGLATAAGITGIFQPFAALYVLVLSLINPILAKKSRLLYSMANSAWRVVTGTGKT